MKTDKDTTKEWEEMVMKYFSVLERFRKKFCSQGAIKCSIKEF